MNVLYYTSEGIKKYKKEDSLLTVKQDDIITNNLNILPIGTIVLLPKNHDLKGFLASGNILDISSTNYALIHTALKNKLIQENKSISTIKNCLL